MPKGPGGVKRPGDVIGAAVKSMRVLTGEDDDTRPNDGKSAAAKELGAMGGAARAKKLSAKRKSEIAKKAAQKRWKREKP